MSAIDLKDFLKDFKLPVQSVEKGTRVILDFIEEGIFCTLFPDMDTPSTRWVRKRDYWVELTVCTICGSETPKDSSSQEIAIGAQRGYYHKACVAEAVGLIKK